MTKHFIGADAAKLAGLQIDLLAKMRLGQITMEHFEWFLAISKPEREALMLGKKKATKQSAKVREMFVVLADLGVITVPQEYVHTAEFLMLYKSEFVNSRSKDVSVNPGIFLNPDRILKAGDKFHVRLFQTVDDCVSATVYELHDLFTKEKAVYAGLQGASLVMELKGKQLPVGISCMSFEAEKRLIFPDRDIPVPFVKAISTEEYYTHALGFSCACMHGTAFILFTDVTADAASPDISQKGVPGGGFQTEESFFPNGNR